MKSPIFIILIFSLILGCSIEPAKQPTHEVKLFEGTYYTDEWQRSDTLVFESRKPYSKIRSWSMMIWKISGDSIVRQDCRGLLDFFGKANCTFTLKGNLLTLKYKSGLDRYKVVKSTGKRFELIALTKSTRSKKDHDIRSDIQLR